MPLQPPPPPKRVLSALGRAGGPVSVSWVSSEFLSERLLSTPGVLGAGVLGAGVLGLLDRGRRVRDARATAAQVQVERPVLSAGGVGHDQLDDCLGNRRRARLRL